MSAKIIAQNHNVISYELNGRKRFIVEQNDNAESFYYRIVSESIQRVGRDWVLVTNDLDDYSCTLPACEAKQLNSWIAKLTY